MKHLTAVLFPPSEDHLKNSSIDETTYFHENIRINPILSENDAFFIVANQLGKFTAIRKSTWLDPLRKYSLKFRPVT
jgi:hypothetical protein